VLIIQIGTGILLSFHYLSDVTTAFNSVVYINNEVYNGWLIRTIHMNGASLFFVIIYSHIAKGFFYSSHFLWKAWIRGIIIYLVLIGTAFLGYVLPWGQISLWGAIVITNLISVIPILGNKIIVWLWGGYRIGLSTLNCFYSIHYLLPFIIIMIIIIHIIFLHETASSGPISGSYDPIIKIKFDPNFSIKDILNIVLVYSFILLNLSSPFKLIESENSIKANYISSPIHIVPEWYFLYVYAVLRSIPNKIGGVFALCVTILLLFMVVLLQTNWGDRNIKRYSFNFFLFVATIFILTWLGSQPVEWPYIELGVISAIAYLIFFIYKWDFMRKAWSFIFR